MARGSSRRVASAKSGGSRSIGRERTLSGPTSDFGVIGTGTKLAAGGAARSDLSGKPAMAKSRGSKPGGRLGGSLRRGRS